MSSSNFRKDIAGLRGIAIIFVVLNHLTSVSFKNGYAGVDLFFVLSGYLIIGGMIKSYEKSILTDKANAKYNISAFYLRRILRLAPAAIVVTLFTLSLSVIFFNSVRATIVIKDAFWSSIFLANYHFMQTGVDYFSRQTIPSPFQHFWSLSIEEQFYLAFPAIFVFTLSLHGFKIGRLSIGWRGRINLLLVFGFLASYFLAFNLVSSDPTSFYFSTFARAWQLILGGIIYIIQSRIEFSNKLKGKIFRSLILLLLFVWILIGGQDSAVSFSVMNAASFFGGLAILFFANSDTPGRFLLENRFLIFFGSISYSLYLWHWPIRIFTQNWIQEPLLIDLIFVTSSILIATLSRKYIELPFLSIKPSPSFKISELPLINRIPRINPWELKVKAWIALLAIFAMPGLALFNSSNIPSPTILMPASNFSSDFSNNSDSTLLNSETDVSLSVGSNGSYEKALSEWKVKISEGLKIQKVPPTLDPSFTKILEEKGPQWSLCLFEYKNNNCRFGDISQARKIVVFGDSFATSLIPAVEEAFAQTKAQIIGLNLHECGVSNVTPWLLGTPYDECVSNREWALSRIKSLRPDLVIMAENATFPITYSGSIATDSQRDLLWAQGLTETFDKLSTLETTLVYVGQWPIRERSITDCVDSKLSISSLCIGRTTNSIKLRSTAQSIALKSKINYVDSSRWLCDSYMCPAIIMNSPVTFDNAHLATTFSRKLGPLLQEYLKSIGVVF
jgi:peptidoglycan/LPS O-acetylase OafA/YrhL